MTSTPHIPPRQRLGGSKLSHPILGVVLAYAVGSALWILLSDHVLNWLLQDPDQRLLASTLKGWLYVAITSALLYLALRHFKRPSATPALLSDHPARARLPWLAMALLASTVIGLTAWAITDRYQSAKGAAFAQLQAIADAKARQIQDHLTQRLHSVTLLQSSTDLERQWQAWHEQGKPLQRLDIADSLRRIVAAGRYSQAALIDAKGVAIWHPATVNTPPAPELLAGIELALTAGQPQRVGPWRDAQGVLQLAFIVPLALQADEPAALVLQLPMSAGLQGMLGSWPLPHSSAESLLLRTEKGEVRLISEQPAPVPLPGQAQPRPASLAEVTPAMLQTQAVQRVDTLDDRGIRVLGVLQRVGQTDWWLLVKQNHAELLAPAIQQCVTLGLMGLLAFFALAVAFYLFEQHRRLERSHHDLGELRRTRAELSASEQRYRLLAENSSDVIWLVDLNTLRFAYISPSVFKLRGYTPQEVLQQGPQDYLAPQSAALIDIDLPKRLAAFAQGDESQRTQTIEAVQPHKDGRHIFTEVVTTLITDPQGKPYQVLGVSRDITARKQDQARILRLSQAMEQSPASVVITDLQARIEYVNQAFEQISGYTRAEVLGQNPRLLRSGKTPPPIYQSMWQALLDGRRWTGEVINRHKSGREYVQSVTIAPLRDEAGQVSHYLSVQLDVTAQHQAEAKAHELAWFDRLTGLPNRHQLLAELADTLGRNKRLKQQSVLILINIDRFKTLNDALGLNAGDHLLQLVGQRLADNAARPGDLLARLGADEFALLMHPRHAQQPWTASDALHQAESIHQALATPFNLPEGRQVSASVCMGITLLPHTADDHPNDVLRRADMALHRAKSAGTRQTAFFDAAMGQVVSQRFALEQDLRRGLAAGELRLFLQPQVDSAGRTVSAEALVRWQHPEQGLLPPGLFIAVAEESDLINELGDWVLREVCVRLGQWQLEGRRLPVAVNISPRQFHQADFVPKVLQCLADTQASPSDLILEITEGVVVERMDDVVRRMLELTRHGVRFSIDDFGTGYSSLSYLKNLPIHELKIDRSFVQDAPQDPNSAALVEAILSVARHLRLRVVAEGVETPEQAALFHEHPNVLLQGYFFGRPEPADQLTTRLFAMPLPTAQGAL